MAETITVTVSCDECPAKTSVEVPIGIQSDGGVTYVVTTYGTPAPEGWTRTGTTNRCPTCSERWEAGTRKRRRR